MNYHASEIWEDCSLGTQIRRRIIRRRRRLMKAFIYGSCAGLIVMAAIACFR